MTNRHNNISHFLFFMVLNWLFVQVHAQTAFSHKTVLAPVSKTGFYKLQIPPDIIGRSKSDLSDLRIMDENGKEIPYAHEDGPGGLQMVFEAFPIVKKGIQSDKKMHVVVSNTGLYINELVLEITNNEANRTLSINGSDDDGKWYVIKENIPAANYTATKKGSYELHINLPPSAPRFIDIICNEKELTPINIVRAGYYSSVTATALYDTVRAISIAQKDSNKISYIAVQWDLPYPIDRINITASGSLLYRRPVLFGADVHKYFISSTDSNYWYPFHEKAKTIPIKIFNNDNPALKIMGVKGILLQKFLYVQLAPSKKYTLFFGNEKLPAPVYDLDFFKPMIAAEATAISTGNIEPNESVTVLQKTETGSKVLLWAIIAATVLLLLFITINLTRQINKTAN